MLRIQWTVNQILILTAIKAAEPQTSIRQAVFGGESLHNDVTELCVSVLATLAIAMSLLAVVVALPLVTMLQRSVRHSQLLKDARADSKTGLLNAATWERESTAEVARAVRTRTPLAVALLDIDKFKGINDTYGHMVGDQVIKEIACTLNSLLRDYDLAGRFGGEEFSLLLPQTRAVDAFRIAERVRANIAAPEHHRSRRVQRGEGACHGVDRGGGAGQRKPARVRRPDGRGRRGPVPGQGLRPGSGADDQHHQGSERGQQHPARGRPSRRGAQRVPPPGEPRRELVTEAG